jgi:hypothetical protein
MRLLLMAAVVAGCGVAPVTVGAVCEADAAPTCVDSKTVAYCESQHWQGYACPSGCVDAAAGASCAWTGVDAGAACPMLGPPEVDGRWGQCASATVFQQCVGGVWELRTCGTCESSAYVVRCTP